MIGLYVILALLTIAVRITDAYQSTNEMRYGMIRTNHKLQQVDSQRTFLHNQHQQFCSAVDRACCAIQAQQRSNRALYAPSSLPRDFHDNFSTMGLWERATVSHGDLAGYHKEWQSFLSKNQLSVSERQCYERAQMRRWNQYEYSAFVQFLQTLSVYDEYLKEIVHHYAHDPIFADNLHKLFPWLDWKQLLRSELYAIEHKRMLHSVREQRTRELQEQELLQQKYAPIRVIYEAQLPEVHACMDTWKQFHPERVHAYNATIAEHGTAVLHAYSLSHSAQNLLEWHGCKPQVYRELLGNSLQHELMQEIITAVDGLAGLSVPTAKEDALFVTTIREYTIKALDCARIVNAQGNCTDSSKLIDLGQGLHKYLDAIGQGLVHGFCGYFSASVEAFLHPITAAQSVASSLTMLMSFLPSSYEYCDAQGNYLMDSPRLYNEDCERITQQWKSIVASITGPVMAHMVTSAVVGIITHAAIARLAGTVLNTGKTISNKALIKAPWLASLGNAALQTMRSISQKTKNKWKKTVAKIRYVLDQHVPPQPSPILCTSEGRLVYHGVPQAQNIILLAESPHIHVPTEPHIIIPAMPPQAGLITNAEQIAAELARIQAMPYELVMECVTSIGSELGYSPKDIACVIERFKDPKINISIERFAAGIERFKNVEGGQELIHKIFKHMLNPTQYNRSNGSLYELAGTRTLEVLENESIAKFTINLVKGSSTNEYDFMTNKYLGECKNVYWPIALKNKDDLDDFLRKLTNFAKNAKEEFSKEPMLITRHPLPLELDNIAETIANYGIHVRTGY